MTRSKPGTESAGFAALAAGLALLAGCAGGSKQIRQRAASEFSCPQDSIAVEVMQFGYRARGCGKEALYIVDEGRVTRYSEIRKATDDPPALPIDNIPGTNSIIPR